MIRSHLKHPAAVIAGVVAALLLAFALARAPHAAAPSAMLRVEPVAQPRTSVSGAALPARGAAPTVSKYHLASRGSIHAHKHPWPRYTYVVSGNLVIADPDTGRFRSFAAGSLIAEDVGLWHEERNLEAEPVELLVIDMVAPPKTNLVFRAPPAG